MLSKWLIVYFWIFLQNFSHSLILRWLHLVEKSNFHQFRLLKFSRLNAILWEEFLNAVIKNFKSKRRVGVKVGKKRDRSCFANFSSSSISSVLLSYLDVEVVLLQELKKDVEVGMLLRKKGGSRILLAAKVHPVSVSNGLWRETSIPSSLSHPAPFDTQKMRYRGGLFDGSLVGMFDQDNLWTPSQLLANIC